MLQPFSASEKTSRGPVAFAVVAVFSLFAASCLGVLDIEDYQSVPESLCSLYERCYGPEAFVGCLRHVSGQLEVADAEAREDYLDAFPDCLDTCKSAQGCLDQPLLCRALREDCGAEAQCCGFSQGQITCFGQACCAVKDAPCTTNVDCCAGQCAGGKCVKDPDPVCAQLGQACSVTSDCCTGECTDGLCTKPCGQVGTACAGSADCCSGICTGGVCANACNEAGSVCTTDADCCSGQCANSLCRKNGCVGSGELCLSDVDCCNDACDKSRGICGNFGCFPTGTPCEFDGSCCSSQCNPAEGTCTELSCKKTGESCGADNECCGLFCNGSCQCAPVGTECSKSESFKCCSGFCDADKCAECRPVGTTCTENTDCCSGACNAGLCCNFVGCSHSVCFAGNALSAKDCAPQNVGAAEASCIDLICDQDPSCCCTMWSQACVDMVETVCKLVCP